MIGVLGFDSRWGLEIFLFTTASRTALGPTQPPIQWVPEAFSLGGNRPGREAGHLPPFSAEVKMRGAIPPLPQYAFMAWCSVKAQGQLYLYLLLGRGISPSQGRYLHRRAQHRKTRTHIHASSGIRTPRSQCSSSRRPYVS
jgi:hypothetical protein